jgi:zinc protease
MRYPLVAGWLVIVLAATAASNSMAITKTNSTASVRKTVLDNGLTVLVREDHSAPVVTAQTWVRAGSITEGKWMGAGMSHILEHMLFKGTATRGVSQIAREVEDKGGYMNAYTSFEQTVFYINIPSESWQTAVDVLADCMMNASIPEEEMLKEKKVIIREMDMNRDDPDRRASLLMWNTAYSVHPYRLPVIGYRDIYDQVTRADVVAYYKRMYAPNNIVFVVVGDVNADEVLAHVRELTKDFHREPIEPAYVPLEPPQLSLRERHEEMPVKISRVDLAWHIPSLADPDVYPLDVLAIVLGQGRSSRLYRQLLEKGGLVHSVEASSYTPHYPGLFVIEAVTDPDKRDAAIAGIRAEIASLADHPASKEEAEKAVKISVSNFLNRLKTMEGQASDLAHNQILVDDPNFSEVYLENLRKVTPSDLQRVTRRYFTDNNLTITTLDPTETGARATAAVAPSEGIKIQKFELANGLRLLVREDPKLPLVDIRAVLKGGVLAETEADNGITKLMARTLLKGTKTRSADQISDAIESVGGEISYFSGNNSFGVSTHMLSEDFDLGLTVLADVLQNPTFPEDKLAREREVQLAEIKEEEDKILRAAQQLMRQELFAHHPYGLNALGTSESVAKLTQAGLRAFHQRYVTPRNLVLTVFGDVRADDVRKKVEAAFGHRKATPLEFPQANVPPFTDTVSKEEFQPKQQAVLLLGFRGTDMFKGDRYPLDLLDEAYSGQGSRLFSRIRDELGLAYYVGAYQLVGLDTGCFVMYVGTTPENVATCQQEFLAELVRLEKDGLSEDELTRAKNSLIGQRKVQLQDNSQLSMMIALDELYGLGYDFFRTMDARYRAVTADDIKRVAQKYFENKPYAIAVVRPPEK